MTTMTLLFIGGIDRADRVGHRRRRRTSRRSQALTEHCVQQVLCAADVDPTTPVSGGGSADAG
jgi:hypothetical protein